MATSYDTGTLGATSEKQAMQDYTYPCTVTLKSTAAGRLIRLSTDGGSEFFIPQLDTETPTQLTLSIGSPVTHVEFTGNIGDKWVIV